MSRWDDKTWTDTLSGARTLSHLVQALQRSLEVKPGEVVPSPEDVLRKLRPIWEAFAFTAMAADWGTDHSARVVDDAMHCVLCDALLPEEDESCPDFEQPDRVERPRSVSNDVGGT